MSRASLYYPPRAGWTSPWRRRLRRLRSGAKRLWLSSGSASENILLSASIPGFSFVAYHPKAGVAATLAYFICCLGFFFWLGHPEADRMLVAMLSIHASSLGFFIKRRVRHMRFGYRLAGMALLVGLLGGFVYYPLSDAIDAFIVPLRVGSSVIVTRRVEPRDIQRGDWIAYRVDAGSGVLPVGYHHGAYRVASGYGLGPVLAVPGDTVRFGKGYFSVNGKSSPALKSMPVTGRFRVPDRQWFVWPSFATEVHNFPERELADLLLSLSLVTEKTFVGRPFNRWFFRKQTLHEPL